jgi:hypothetical protein
MKHNMEDKVKDGGSWTEDALKNADAMCQAMARIF